MRNILCVCVLPLLESENCHPDFWFGNHNALAACKNPETTAETAGSSLVLEQRSLCLFPPFTPFNEVIDIRPVCVNLTCELKTASVTL